MVRNLYPLFVMMLAQISFECHGQLASADAKGKSAIIFDATSLNFDLAETSLSINVNNFSKQRIARQRQLIWGVSVSGKNNEGIANLINEGRFLPSSQLRIFIGGLYRLPKADFKIESDIRKIRNRGAKEHYEALMNFKGTTDSIFTAHISNIHTTRRKGLQDDLVRAARGSSYKEVLNNLDALATTISNWTANSNEPSIDALKTSVLILVKAVIDEIKADYAQTQKPFPQRNSKETLEQVYFRDFEDLQVLEHQETETRKQTTRRKVIPYASFGITGSQVKIYDKMIVDSFSKRFVKTPFTGVFFDGGVNFDVCRNSMIGLSLGLERANTIDSLTATDYTIKETEQSATTELISEKKEKGYTGTYEIFTRINLRFDALHFLRLGETGYIIWNIPYVRYAISDKSRAAINLLNLGTSANFFKEQGKFAGGIYLEALDVPNQQYNYQLKIANTEEAKARIREDRTSVWGRLTFGVVAKFAIQTIVNPQQW